MADEMLKIVSRKEVWENILNGLLETKDMKYEKIQSQVQKSLTQ